MGIRRPVSSPSGRMPPMGSCRMTPQIVRSRFLTIICDPTTFSMPSPTSLSLTLSVMTQNGMSWSRSETNRPSSTWSLFISLKDWVTPSMVRWKLFPLWVSSTNDWVYGTASMTAGQYSGVRNAAANGIWAGWPESWSGRTERRSVPMAMKASMTWCLTISATETMAMTDPMPMTMPSRASRERCLASHKQPRASWKFSPRIMFRPPRAPRRSCGPAGRTAGPGPGRG